MVAKGDSLQIWFVILWSPEASDEGMMRPKERRDSGQADLMRSRLDAIIDMNHALVKLARTIDWSFLEERFGRSTRTSRVGRRCRRA